MTKLNSEIVKCYRILLSFLVFVILSDWTIVNAQEINDNNRVFYKNDLDYLPSVKTWEYEKGKGNYEVYFVHSGLREAFELIIALRYNSKSVVTNLDEENILSSGIIPKYLLGKTWISIEINELGKVISFDINPKNDINEILGLTLKNSLDNCEILPALKANQPVNCRLFYSIDVERNRYK